jgi:tetratricopeptide (TPR) repeat protein
VRLGLWEETIGLNLRAAATGAHAAREHRGDYTYQIHAMDYLRYAYLQRGLASAARALQDELRDVPAAPAEEIAFNRAYFHGRTAIELQQWSEAAALPIPDLAPSWLSEIFWARTIGAARSGQLIAARENLTKLRDSVGALFAGRPGGSSTAAEMPIAQLEAEAWVAFVAGNSQQAISYLRLAANRESAEGGESVKVPAGEMLAEVFFEMRRFNDSLKAFEAVLRAAPNRFNALLGAARVADALGRAERARGYYRQLLDVAAPDADRPELDAAKASLSN